MKNKVILFLSRIYAFQLQAQVQPMNAVLSNEKSFSMVLLPDPQSYTKFDVNQPFFEQMATWTANKAWKTESYDLFNITVQ